MKVLRSFKEENKMESLQIGGLKWVEQGQLEEGKEKDSEKERNTISVLLLQGCLFRQRNQTGTIGERDSLLSWGDHAQEANHFNSPSPKLSIQVTQKEEKRIKEFPVTVRLPAIIGCEMGPSHLCWSASSQKGRVGSMVT